MLDRYWRADADRISPEAPVPVARVSDTQDRMGGAANVAQNISSLGGKAELLGVAGNDAEGLVLESLLRQHNIQASIVKSDAIRTTSKIRIVSRNQQLIRLDFDDRADQFGNEVAEAFASCVNNHEIVVLSDYGKGVLSDPQNIIAVARECGKKVVVDPKGNDFAKYRDATVITPNYSEFCAVVGECASEQEIREKAQQLCQQLSIEALLITRSEQGMTLVKQSGETANFPAQVREVYDVTGAGDTVISVFAMSLAVDGDLEQAARVANVAAGIVVGKFGAATLTAEELQQGLLNYEFPSSKLISDQLLAQKIADAQAKGDKVVLTNGCFDVLHKGHTHLLRQAESFGDMVVVALNSDESVRRLKGSDRPINNLQDRAEMLSHLSPVDWVVSFEQDTPLELIETLQPDVLVKGGDYTIDEIVGAEVVTQRGGEVKIVPFVEGYSTSKLISSIVDNK